MLPQPDPHVLQSNPQFELVYRDLQKDKLHANGSSRIRDERVLKEEVGFREALHDARVEEAKKEILRDTVAAVGYRVGGLSDELQDVVQIVAAQLEGKINDVDRDVAEGEVEYFLEQINQIEPAISDDIEQNVILLSSILDPSTPPSDLATEITTLKTRIATSQSKLSQSRTALATQAIALLTLYTTLFSTSIRILEQVLHGSLSRHTRARAAYLSVVAEGMEKKFLILKAQVVNQVYDKETRLALEGKMEAVDGKMRRVGREGRWRGGVLGELEAKGRGLEKVAEDVGAVRAELKRVWEEVERVERGGS